MRLAPLLLFVLSALAAPAAGQMDVLVYHNNTVHGFGETAALTIEPAAVVATSANFNAQLTGGTAWDVVVVDCPSATPVGGWSDLIAWVAGGGRAVMSFWDWDASSSVGDPALPGAFDVGIASTFSLLSLTLNDSGASSVFNGVTMPNGNWHNHWGDDGDEFTLLGTAVGLADVGNPSTPCLVLGNEGRTIAAPLLDEAGDTWVSDGSGVQLWTNMINLVLGGASVPPASATLYGCGVNPPGSLLIGFGLPTLGGTVTLGIDNPLGTQAVGSIPFLVHAFAPDPAFPCGTSLPGFGMGGPGAAGELLISLAPPTPIAPIVVGPAWTGTVVPFAVSVPNDPTLLGISVFSQGLLSDPSVAFGVRFGLTDAVELVIGS